MWLGQCDRLKPNKKGLANMAGYMVQDSNGKKHWTQSQNLVKPWHRAPTTRSTASGSWRRSQSCRRTARSSRKFWERQYRGWELVDCEKLYAEQSGWYFYLTMKRKRGDPAKAQRQRVSWGEDEQRSE